MRRGIVCGVVLVLSLSLLPATGSAQDAGRLWSALAGGGHIALMRHALAPGTGDPDDFRIDDCATQRNLNGEGRAQARRIGEAFRRNGVDVDRVLSSQWCRCLETAELLTVGDVEAFPALNSFFRAREREAGQTGAVRDLLAELPLNGASLVMVTHQVNITALTGVFPRSGEIVVLKLDGAGGFEVAGRLQPL